MSRGGYRKGAGRKREYQEPVQKILLGLPESVLKKLDIYAKEHNLSRPKAIALLLETETVPKVPATESISTILEAESILTAQESKIDPETPQKPKKEQNLKVTKKTLLEELKALKNSLN